MKCDIEYYSRTDCQNEVAQMEDWFTQETEIELHISTGVVNILRVTFSENE